MQKSLILYNASSINDEVEARIVMSNQGDIGT
jgi:hypothetical protein